MASKILIPLFCCHRFRAAIWREGARFFDFFEFRVIPLCGGLLSAFVSRETQRAVFSERLFLLDDWP